MKHLPSLKAIKHPASQKGFSLIEVLITLLILAVGSLGIAAMQIAGLKYSAGAHARSQATQLAEDMASRLKTNRDEALDLQTDGSYGSDPGYVIDSFAYTYSSSDDCITGTCTPTQLTEYDKSSWLVDVARSLPSGQGQVTFNDTVNADGATERIYLIAIQWRQASNSSDEDGDEADDVKSVTFRVSI